MIVKGLKAIEKHLASLSDMDRRSRPWYYEPRRHYATNPDRDESWGMNQVSDHDEDYVFDALFNVPNR